MIACFITGGPEEDPLLAAGQQAERLVVAVGEHRVPAALLLQPRQVIGDRHDHAEHGRHDGEDAEPEQHDEHAQLADPHPHRAGLLPRQQRLGGGRERRALAAPVRRQGVVRVGVLDGPVSFGGRAGGDVAFNPGSVALGIAHVSGDEPAHLRRVARTHLGVRRGGLRAGLEPARYPAAQSARH